MTDAISVLPLGGCLMHGPLNPEARRGNQLRYPPYGRVPGVYTFGEMFQVIDVLQGKREVPAEIEPLCAIHGNFHAVATASDFRDVDVVLAEPSSPVDITFRGCYLNRTAMSQLISPIRDAGPMASKQFNRWFRTGLIEVNEAVREEAAEALIPFISDKLLDADLIRAVLLETRSARADVANNLRRLRSVFGRPIGIVNYIFQYMPDGRAISWPAGFHEEIEAVTRQLDLPLFQPASLVNQYGVEATLRPDLRHYKDEFLPVMAQALIDFARTVKAKSAKQMAGAT